MLHPIGEDKAASPRSGRISPRRLKAGYSVLMFDSEAAARRPSRISSCFAKVKTDQPQQCEIQRTKRLSMSRTISKPEVYVDLPVLVNAILPPHVWLDRRNDESKDCNTSSLMIIAADQGHVGCDMDERRMAPLQVHAESGCFLRLFQIPSCSAHAREGKDIIAAVFLTPQPTLEKAELYPTISKLLKTACNDNGTATALFPW